MRNTHAAAYYNFVIHACALWCRQPGALQAVASLREVCHTERPTLEGPCCYAWHPALLRNLGVMYLHLWQPPASSNCWSYPELGASLTHTAVILQVPQSNMR